MEMYVGLDVHSKASVFVTEDETGRVVGRGEVPTTPAGLRRLCETLPAQTTIALESGTVAFYVARKLSELKMRAVVIDAHEVRQKAHRPMHKSDRRDAFELCEGIRCGQYRSIVHVPPVEIGELRETLSRRRHFVRVRSAEIHAVKRLLRSAGLGELGRSVLLRSEASWKKLFTKLGKEDTALEVFVRDHFVVWSSAHERVGDLDRRLAELETRFDASSRLQTVPGVGVIVALTTIAVFSDVTRFHSTKHAASYVGLVPSTQQSGDRDTHGHITKRGSAELRAMLCEAAHQARRPDHPLNPYFAKICAKRGYRTAVICVAHRLCRILYAMLRRGTDFDLTKLNVERGPFRRTTERTYRIRPVTSATVAART